MPVNSLSLFSSSAIHCLPLSFALLSSSTSAEYPLFIIFPSFNEIEGSAIIAEFNNSFKSSNVSMNYTILLAMVHLSHLKQLL